MLVRYSDLKQIERAFTITNSPEFALLNTSNWLERKTGFEQDMIGDLKERTKVALESDKKLIKSYIDCLELTRDNTWC